MDTIKTFDIEPISSKNVTHPITRLAFSYWSALRQSALLPIWSHFDCLDEPELIPHSALFEVMWQGERPVLTCKMIGNNLADLYGDITGLTLEADENQQKDNCAAMGRSHALLTQTATKRDAFFARGNISIPTYDYKMFEMITLPFEDGRETLTHVICVVTLS